MSDITVNVDGFTFIISRKEEDTSILIKSDELGDYYSKLMVYHEGRLHETVSTFPADIEDKCSKVYMKYIRGLWMLSRS